MASGLKFTTDDAGTDYWNFGMLPNGTNLLHLGRNGNSNMSFLTKGYVGIGTTNPTSKLTVKGTIHSIEVKVTQTVPADYVFQKYYLGKSELKPDYKLLNLSEIEKFTEANHHLPNVPSAKEIKENGLHLGEMSNLLLQKIEELTLYSIDQQKIIEKQTVAIEKLENENKAFKSIAERLSKIETAMIIFSYNKNVEAVSDK